MQIRRIFAGFLVLSLVFCPVVLVAQSHHRTDVWAVGVHGHDGFAWDGFESFGGPGISFKAPKIPIFWDVSLGLKKNNWLNVGVSGDYYLLDKTFEEEINLGWYLGIGAYAGVTFSGVGEDSRTKFGGGIRVPIGLSWIYKEKLEVFGAWAPNIGTSGSMTFEVGVRYWMSE
ncbi:hypothetical protein [Candidatus Symbiothrix dinenymphae]|uniref:hypothetical protein n=1 Tax=Candidatus Symbiothrix dinenymphae TaxID=467085 RepID=UPI0006C4452B|nr:hypothetical protein [Candidatus Symbiothrix dinenymphae]GAP73412.1 hypothetical protein SAMD00024442_9_10 [Candidatus Symbiothrix dinenymphae]